MPARGGISVNGRMMRGGRSNSMVNVARAALEGVERGHGDRDGGVKISRKFVKFFLTPSRKVLNCGKKGGEVHG